MKTSHLPSVITFLGLTLGTVGVEAQGNGDAELLVPLARAVIGAPAEADAVPGAVVEELPTVIAPRWAAQGDAPNGAIPAAYWLGFLSLCAGSAALLLTRRPARDEGPRHSLPPSAGDGRISLV